MLKKVFDKVFLFVKDVYKDLLICLLIWFCLTYEFPYYIDATGGAINVSNRVEVVNKYDSTGSFNMAYVRELPGNIIFLTLAWFNSKWDIVKYEDVLLDNETKEDEFNRNRILLDESTNNAIRIAYGAAGKEVDVETEKMVVTFVASEAKTGIKTGDEILLVDGKSVKTLAEIKEIVNSHKVGDKISFKIKRNEKEMVVRAVVYDEDNSLYVGIGSAIVTELKTNPELKLDFEESESGPSGGLITALAIYDSLIEYDLTHGLKIIGTGTMESDGTVGSIGGVKYKLNGAVKKKADIFLVPAGENYDEALKLKKENKYNIEIVAVKNFSDAVSYLMNLS